MTSVGPRPSPPITIDDNGDLEVYRDVTSACNNCEVYDVRELSAFDSRGAQLQFVTRDYQVVGLKITDGEPIPGVLEARLRDFIRREGPGRIRLTEFESAPLPVLLEGLLAFFESGPH